jgi:hypothetical protein
MPEPKRKLTYYVKSGDQYLTGFDNGSMPVMAYDKRLAFAFTSQELAEARAQKLRDMKIPVFVEVDDTVLLEE